jgi:hypothetical protein
MILLDPDTNRSSVSAGKEGSDDPDVMTGSVGASLPRMSSCDVATSSLAVTLATLAATEPTSGGELSQIARYKTPVSHNNNMKVRYLLRQALLPMLWKRFFRLAPWVAAL